MKKILVTGATGHLGTAVIQQLLKSMPAQDIAVMTRNSEKQAEWAVKGFSSFLGDYRDRASLDKAMQGVDTVLLISSGDQGDRMQEHKNVVDATVKNGVRHLAYTSRCLKDRYTLANALMSEHFATEDYIINSGLTHTFFRNILYMDTLPQFIGGHEALANGIFLPAGEGRVSFALREEMGEAMANVLLKAAGTKTTYLFTGAHSYSFYEVAAALSELFGKEIRYTPIDTLVYTNRMKDRNLPEPVIKKIVDFMTDIRHNQESEVYPDLEQELGRMPTELKTGIKALF